MANGFHTAGTAHPNQCRLLVTHVLVAGAHGWLYMAPYPFPYLPPGALAKQSAREAAAREEEERSRREAAQRDRREAEVRLATCYLPLTSYVLIATCRLLLTACHLPPATYVYLPLATCLLLLATCDLPLATGSSLGSPFATRPRKTLPHTYTSPHYYYYHTSPQTQTTPRATHPSRALGVLPPQTPQTPPWVTPPRALSPQTPPAVPRTPPAGHTAVVVPRRIVYNEDGTCLLLRTPSLPASPRTPACNPTGGTPTGGTPTGGGCPAWVEGRPLLSPSSTVEEWAGRGHPAWVPPMQRPRAGYLKPLQER